MTRARAELGSFLIAASLTLQEGDPNQLAQQVRFASQELELAKAEVFYYVLDAGGRTLTLKLRGVELRRFPLLSVDLGEPLGGPGDPDWLARVYEFQKDSSTQRQEMTPGQAPGEPALPADPDTADTATPSSFTLRCEPGLTIRIRAESERTFSASISDRWALDEPMGGVRLRLRLADENVRSLYRSLPDKAKILFTPVW